MNLSDAIEGYFIAKTGNRRGDLSPKTIKLYRFTLARLISFLDDPQIENITTRDLEQFMASIADIGYSSYHQANHFKSIRSLWAWASSTLDVPKVHLKLRAPVVVVEPVSPFSQNDIARILAACESTTRTSRKTRLPYTQSRQTETRDKAIIFILLDTGIRLGELSRLTLADIDMDNARLRVVPYRTGKKSRPRDIPFGRATKKQLWRYITDTKPDAKAPLFGLSLEGVQSLFSRLGQRSGVNGVHAHRFRHTFAIEYLRNGGDIFTLQYILGHSDLAMCQRYLAIAKADVQNAHAKASPVDKWV